METIEIKNRFTNEVIFSHECENNTVKITVEKAVETGAYLRGADLRGAYLTDADLTGADLRGADLRGAYLTDAYLRGADLRGAYLTGANLTGADLTGAYLTDAYLTGAYLRGADLRGADLTGADLRGAYLTGANIPIYCKWAVSIVDVNIRIGCKTKSIEEWDAFFASDEEFATYRNTDDFIRIRAMYEAYKSYINVINTIKA